MQKLTLAILLLFISIDSFGKSYQCLSADGSSLSITVQKDYPSEYHPYSAYLDTFQNSTHTYRTLEGKLERDIDGTPFYDFQDVNNYLYHIEFTTFGSRDETVEIREVQLVSFNDGLRYKNFLCAVK